jgi:hypothetical protein
MTQQSWADPVGGDHYKPWRTVDLRPLAVVPEVSNPEAVTSEAFGTNRSTSIASEGIEFNARESHTWLKPPFVITSLLGHRGRESFSK